MMTPEKADEVMFEILIACVLGDVAGLVFGRLPYFVGLMDFVH